MVTWRVEEECLLPERKITLRYKGLRPIQAYHATMEMVLRIFEAEPEDVWERDFRWDTTIDPRDFFVRIYVKKPIDAKTHLLAEIIFHGLQPSDVAKPGEVTITIAGRLVTEYKLDKFWKRSHLFKAAIWLYHRWIYDDVRKDYMRLCNEWLMELWRQYRLSLGIPTA
jgi:hypothetical protein